MGCLSAALAALAAGTVHRLVYCQSWASLTSSCQILRILLLACRQPQTFMVLLLHLRHRYQTQGSTLL